MRTLAREVSALRFVLSGTSAGSMGVVGVGCWGGRERLWMVVLTAVRVPGLCLRRRRDAWNSGA